MKIELKWRVEWKFKTKTTKMKTISNFKGQKYTLIKYKPK